MSLIIAMCLFAVSMSISPGPVNLVTFSSGLNYGFVPTLPFVAGAALGFAVLLVVVLHSVWLCLLAARHLNVRSMAFFNRILPAAA